MIVESGFIPFDHDLNFGPGRGMEIARYPILEVFDSGKQRLKCLVKKLPTSGHIHLEHLMKRISSDTYLTLLIRMPIPSGRQLSAALLTILGSLTSTSISEVRHSKADPVVRSQLFHMLTRSNRTRKFGRIKGLPRSFPKKCTSVTPRAN